MPISVFQALIDGNFNNGIKLIIGLRNEERIRRIFIQCD
jgi:hypothetical protein